MPDANEHIDQQEELRRIMSEYDLTTRKLYQDVLDLYSEKGVQVSKAVILGEIKDKVKEAAK